jgi:molybdopterin synthase catalytic subunit
LIEITSEPIPVEPVIDRMKNKGHEHAVSFIGTVRDNAEGKRVLYLEYEAYLKMAEKKLQEICDEVQKQSPCDIDVIHRIGRIEIGEVAIVIVVGSKVWHDAFWACQYAIDRIKEIVPIWKKEYYADGSAWVGELPNTK